MTSNIHQRCLMFCHNPCTMRQYKNSMSKPVAFAQLCQFKEVSMIACRKAPLKVFSSISNSENEADYVRIYRPFHSSAAGD